MQVDCIGARAKPVGQFTWNAFPQGQQPSMPVDQVAIDNAGMGGPFTHLRAVPADGTFILGGQTGRVYRIARGAPAYVPSWAPYGGVQPYTVEDQIAIDNAGNGGVWNHLLK